MRIVCEVPQQVLQAAPLQGSAQRHWLCQRTVTAEKTLLSRITEHAAGALTPRPVPGTVQVCAASSADKSDMDGGKLAARHPSSQPAEWPLVRFCWSCYFGWTWVGGGEVLACVTFLPDCSSVAAVLTVSLSVSLRGWEFGRCLKVASQEICLWIM